MDKKQKNLAVTFIMVVGVIFILIAGCICVKQAWEYLPEIVKQLCLLGVGVGSFIGSVFAGKTKLLKKTETALFYLGDAFLGYFMLSLTGSESIKNIIEFDTPQRLLMTTLVLFVPVAVKFFQTKRIAEYIISIILINMVVLFFSICVDAEVGAYVVGVSFVSLFLLAAHQYIGNKKETGKSLRTCTKVCFLVQELYAASLLCFMSFCEEVIGKHCLTSDYFDGRILLEGNLTFVILAVCIVLSGLVWYDNKNKINIFQLVVLSVIFCNMLIYNMVCGQIADALILGVTALMIMILASMKNNKAYIIVSAITLLLIAFYITRTFWLSIAWWVYMFVAGVILVMIAVKKEREGQE